ncbi:MAG: cellulase family glycosylhydrolase [Bacteroides sp.]|nr:cellulase family glycosylhydrolase [Bacteroides sp.]
MNLFIILYSFLALSCTNSKEKAEDFPVQLMFLSQSDGIMNLTSMAQRASLKMVSNADWTVTCDAEWCALDAGTTSGKKGEKCDVFFSVPEHTSGEPRRATLLFRAEDEEKEFRITQHTYDPDMAGMESDARTLAAKIHLGWNLGNTLEAIRVAQSPIVPGQTPLSDITADEQMWGNPKATREFIQAVKAAGFNAVRIPCAWYGYLEEDVNYTIRPAWMQRVQEVVDYCIDNDMYAILNIHWDGGWHDDNCKPDHAEAVNEVQKLLWRQIATHFRDYDERLLFAGANEPDVSEPENMVYLKMYSQTFIDEVRATGGRNTYRNLIIQGPLTNIGHTAEFMNMAEDRSVSNRLMVEVHYYSPYDFALMTEDASWGACAYFWGADHHVDQEVDGAIRNASWGEEEYIKEQFQLMRTHFVDKGIPVILGEYGAIKRRIQDTDFQEAHENSRAYYLEYVTEQAKNYGLVPFYWDNGGYDFSVFDRRQNAVSDQRAIDALKRGADQGKYPF